MARQLDVSVLVRLVDRLSSPLRGLMDRFERLRTLARRISGSFSELGRQIGLVGAAFAALSFTGPLQQAAAWDAQLRDIAITAGMAGGAVERMIERNSQLYEKLALETAQRSMDIAKGAQLLVASGMDATLIERLMPTIARVSTAAGAALTDTARTAFALNNNLKVGADQMEAALGKLIVAGKLGRFEFRNMAAEFPALTAQMQKFGIKGLEAVESLGAGLQIAMFGTDSPSEAANNLKNFLTKVNAPEALEKFRKELGVDLMTVMTGAAAKGLNPVEAVIETMIDRLRVPTAEIDKIMKEAGPAGMRDPAIRQQVEQLLMGSKVGKLYQDMQVLDFLVPMLSNMEKFKQLKADISRAGPGVIIQDFESRVNGLSGEMLYFENVGTQAVRRVGLAFSSNLPMANRTLTWLMQTIERVDQKYPNLINRTLSWAGAFLVAGAGIAILTPVLGALGRVLTLIGRAAMFAARAMLFIPAVRLGLLLAGAALLIVRNWGNVKLVIGGTLQWLSGVMRGDFTSAAEGLRTAWGGLGAIATDAWGTVKGVVRDTLQWIDAQLGTDLTGTARAAWTGLKTTAVEIFGGLGRFIESSWDGVWRGLQELSDKLTSWGETGLKAAGKAIGDAFNWLGDLITDPIKKAKAAWDGLMSLFGRTPAMPKLPAAPSMGAAPTAPGKQSWAPIGGTKGFATMAARPRDAEVSGQIVVRAAAGTVVERVSANNPKVRLVPDHGPVTARA